MKHLPKMRFIVITDGYPKASKLLPTEDFFRYPCEIAKELGLSPEIWTLNIKRLAKREIANGIPVRRFNNSGLLFFNLFCRDIKFIHSFLRPNMASLLAGLLNKKKVFTTVSYELGSTKLIKMVSLFLLKRFDKIISLTPYELGVYKRNGIDPKKLTLLPFAVDYRFFSKKLKNKKSIMKKYSLKKNHFKIITIANFRSCKNLDVMAKAFHIFNKKVPDSDFIVIGQDFLKAEGFYKEQNKTDKTVNSLIEESKNIKWVGERSPYEIRELLNVSDVYVLSSSIEAQGLTNYESASSGIAMCLSTIGSFRTVFKDRILYHNPQDYEALAKNFLKYYKDWKLRKKNSSSVQNLVKNWDFPIIKRRLKELYKELLKIK
ncbi:MAG: glycosyltransferase family 4 protein [Nanoarchaeota archaeon]|nr:glycosyltransferase family 4 protein [Nanoarchaeota archaeon]